MDFPNWPPLFDSEELNYELPQPAKVNSNLRGIISEFVHKIILWKNKIIYNSEKRTGPRDILNNHPVLGRVYLALTMFALIAVNLEYTRGWVSKRLRNLLEAGLVEKSQSSYYEITERGEQYLAGEIEANILEDALES